MCHRCQRHQRQICRRYRWHRWKICHRCQQHKGNWWQNFAAGVVDTSGKFAAGVVDTGGNLPPVLLTPVANLPPVSLTSVVQLDLRISPRIFEKIQNDPNVIITGLGEGDLWKNLKQKISWHCPFNQLKNFFNKHFKEYYLASFSWWIPSSCENHCSLLYKVYTKMSIPLDCRTKSK